MAVEAEDPERPVHGRVETGGEREYLDGDVRLPGGFGELVELAARYLGGGGGGHAAQCGLVDDQPEPGRVGAGEDLLAG